MNSGTIYVWGSYNASNWYYDSEYLSDCDHLTYTWYYSSGKLLENELCLEITDDNGNILNIIKDLEYISKD